MTQSLLRRAYNLRKQNDIQEYGKIQLNTNKLCIHVYTVTFIKTIKIAPLLLPAPLPSHRYLDDCLIGSVGEAGLWERFQGEGSGLMNQFREGTPCIRDSVEDVILKT